MKLQHRSLSWFFVLTFAISWALWLLAARITPATMSFGTRALFFLPGTFTPAFVALWLSARSAEGPQPLLDRLFQWQEQARWYVFAIAYMAAAKLFAAALHRVIAGSWPAFGSTPFYLLLLATMTSTPFQAGEEIGWRGYALPRLASSIGFAGASLLLGAVWALWHLPLFLVSGTDSTGQPFVVFFLIVVALSVAMTWLWVRTHGSLLLLMLMHAAANNISGIVPSARTETAGVFSLDAPLMAWLTVVVLWLAAVYFLVRLAKTRPLSEGVRTGSA